MQTDLPEPDEHGAAASNAIPPAVLPPARHGGQVSVIEALAEIPEEDIWLAKQKSKRTRRAYKQDVRHFMRTLRIRSYEELRQVDCYLTVFSVFSQRTV
jgi:hypothetical protein